MPTSPSQRGRGGGEPDPRGSATLPLHFEGWAHFTQGRDTLLAAFERAGLADLLHLPRPGEWIES
jgi:hypothetical protein